MKPQQAEWMWLDERETVSLTELCSVCEISATELNELIEYGALVPLEADRPAQIFSAHSITQLRTAVKLRADFDLDLFAVAMLLGYLNRIEALERQVRSLQSHLPSQAMPGK
ncbi:chaperone modulator CbpM [Polaromonas eurypsychrophila]|uniref:MerR family transcriptional regulator n=1 Tax=Polaromonas eurypsychrophila TaxID=1614635 RepID=A0A916SEV4_9BURK|nr:chaperone modulator CbpM [Polaromonas eurypsychrophila]GGA96609.1 hypothetical protein GCM10011496_17100 [Polaromonas eurypsychrophila]